MAVSENVNLGMKISVVPSLQRWQKAGKVDRRIVSRVGGKAQKLCSGRGAEPVGGGGGDE